MHSYHHPDDYRHDAPRYLNCGALAVYVLIVAVIALGLRALG